MQNENELKELIAEFKWTNPTATKSLRKLLFGYLYNCEQNNEQLSPEVLFFADYLEQFFNNTGIS